MKRAVKSRLLLLSCFLLALSVVAAICFARKTVFADESAFNVTGAEIRADEPSGLRFNAFIANEKYKSENTYGMLVLPESELPAGETKTDLTLDNAERFNAINAVVGADNGGTVVKMVNSEDGKILKVVITGIPVSAYGTTVLARAYVTENGVTEYSDCAERSVALVASRAKANGETDEILDTFIDGAVKSFTAEKTDYKLIPDQTKKLEATVSGANNLSIVYESSDDCVTVDKDGNVKGIKAGDATVTAKLGTKKIDFNVSVVAPMLVADKETIEINTIETLSGKNNDVNSVASFGFKVFDADGEEVSNIDKSKLILSSDNPRIEFDAEELTFTAKPQKPDNTCIAPPYKVTASYLGGSCSSTAEVWVAVNCKEDMDALAQMAQKALAHFWGELFSYRLTADVDYAGAPIMPVAICGVDGYSWREDYGNLNPAGSAFAATFDGDGHSIKNALIAESLTSGNESARNCVFGYVKGTVKNLCFDGIKFETNKIMINSGMFSQMYGTVENVLVLNGEINANAGDYNAGFRASGFFAGTVGGTIRNCIVQASFSGDGNPAIPGLIYSFPTGDYKVENVYAISPTAHSWVHYYSSGAALPEDSTHKFGSTADLFNAHSEMFGESSAFAFNAASGAITLK